MYEIDMASPSLGQDPDSETGADLRNYEPGDHAHAHQHPHQHDDGTVSGAWHSHDHGPGHVHTDPAHRPGLGLGEMAGDAAAVELGFPDLSGLRATPAEVSALLDAIAEADEEELASWAEDMAGDEMAYPADLAPLAPRSRPGKTGWTTPSSRASTPRPAHSPTTAAS
jgi:hypothetical protein